MSQRGRLFVESWINEYVHPTTYEEPEPHSLVRTRCEKRYRATRTRRLTLAQIASGKEPPPVRKFS